jgi:clan AA aspartic protease
MGKVMTKITLTNSLDARFAAAGTIRPGEVRSVELDALVDTGATTLALPADVVEALGLPELTRRKVRMADGTVTELPVVVDFFLDILGRRTVCEAFVLPAGATPLIGQVPLETLDLIVDPKSRDLAVNPASPDMPLLDLLRVA